MKRVLIGAIALLVAYPVQAQLAPANDSGVSFGHIHLNVTDVDLHKKLR